MVVPTLMMEEKITIRVMQVARKMTMRDANDRGGKCSKSNGTEVIKSAK